MIDLCHGCQLVLNQNDPRKLLMVGHQPLKNIVNRAIVKVIDTDEENGDYYEVYLLELTSDPEDVELIDERCRMYETTFTFCCDEIEDSVEFFNNPSTSDPDTESESEDDFTPNN
jgi:hypothetical protein